MVPRFEELSKVDLLLVDQREKACESGGQKYRIERQRGASIDLSPGQKNIEPWIRYSVMTNPAQDIREW